MILGGGVSKNADKFIPRLEVRPPVVPAVLRNEAGIVGAAMWAAEHAGSRAIRPEDAARAEAEAEVEASVGSAGAEPEVEAAAKPAVSEATPSEPAGASGGDEPVESGGEPAGEEPVEPAPNGSEIASRTGGTTEDVAAE